MRFSYCCSSFQFVATFLLTKTLNRLANRTLEKLHRDLPTRFWVINAFKIIIFFLQWMLFRVIHRSGLVWISFRKGECVFRMLACSIPIMMTHWLIRFILNLWGCLLLILQTRTHVKIANLTIYIVKSRLLDHQMIMWSIKIQVTIGLFYEIPYINQWCLSARCVLHAAPSVSHQRQLRPTDVLCFPPIFAFLLTLTQFAMKYCVTYFRTKISTLPYNVQTGFNLLSRRWHYTLKTQSQDCCIKPTTQRTYLQHVWGQKMLSVINEMKRSSAFNHHNHKNSSTIDVFLNVWCKHKSADRM